MPAPPGATVVRVGGGEHTHVLNPKTGAHLCRSGIKKGVVPPLYESDADYVTCYRCTKLLADKTIQRTFTPSYPARNKEDYERQVRQGNKPLHHTQVRGGRSTARYGGSPPKMSRQTARRLAEQGLPWDARTQSPEVWAQTLGRMGYEAFEHLAKRNPSQKLYGPKGPGLKKRRLMRQIAKGLEALRQTQDTADLGLYVPPFAAPLIEAGVPEKPAYILASRAGGRFISASPMLQPEPELNSFGELYAARFGSLPAVQFLSGGEAVLESRGMGHIQVVGVSFSQAPVQVLLTQEQIADLFNDWVRQVRAEEGGSYRAEMDNPRFVVGLIRQIDEAARDLPGSNEAGRHLFRVQFSNRNVPVDLPFSSLQHSDSVRDADMNFPTRYRTLENVSLNALPEVLAGISLRTKKEGRRLPLLENPMSYWEKQYSQGPFGPSRSLPAARRNRGRPRSRGLIELPVDKTDRPLMDLYKSELIELAAGRGKKAQQAIEELEFRGIIHRTSANALKAGKKRGPKKKRTSRKSSAKKGSSKRKSSSKHKGSVAEMEWAKLIQAASELGLYRVGMTRKQVEAAITKNKKKSTSKKKKSSKRRSKSSSKNHAHTTWPKFQARALKYGYTRKQASEKWKTYKRTKKTLAELLPKKKSSKKKGKSRAKKNTSALVPRRRTRRTRRNPRPEFAVPPPHSHMAADPWHPVYEQVIGQFGVSEAFTHGVQPMNRRNPKKRRKAKRNGKRRLNAYQRFCKEWMSTGMSMSECAAMWRAGHRDLP